MSKITSVNMPSKIEQNALIKAFDKYLDMQDSGNINQQQNAYNKFREKLNEFEVKYPNIDFSNERTMNSLERAARDLLNKKVIKGPGSSY